MSDIKILPTAHLFTSLAFAMNYKSISANDYERGLQDGTLSKDAVNQLRIIINATHTLPTTQAAYMLWVDATLNNGEDFDVYPVTDRFVLRGQLVSG